MAELNAYISAVREIVREANLSFGNDMQETAYTSFIRRALRRYSLDKPRITTKQINGTGSPYIKVDSTNFPNFIDGVSVIDKVEALAPILTDKDAPNYIERDSWDFYRDGTDLYFYFKNDEPAITDKIRFTYTILHTINGLDSAIVDTVSAPDFEAVIYWGAAEAFTALAGKYAGISDPTLRADVVNYSNKSADMRRLAEYYRDLYRNWINLPLKASSLVRDIDFGLSGDNGQSFLTHRSFSRS